MVDGSAEGAPFGVTGVLAGAVDSFVVSGTGVVAGDPFGPPNEYDGSGVAVALFVAFVEAVDVVDGGELPVEFVGGVNWSDCSVDSLAYASDCVGEFPLPPASAAQLTYTCHVDDCSANQ